MLECSETEARTSFLGWRSSALSWTVPLTWDSKSMSCPIFMFRFLMSILHTRLVEVGDRGGTGEEGEGGAGRR